MYIAIIFARAGCAERAKGLGANVIVCEVDPIKAADALMHGLRVMPLNEAVLQADIILTVTGGKHVIRREHFERMKDGVILANAGHFKLEFDLEALQDFALEQKEMRENIRGFLMPNGRWLNLLGGGDTATVKILDILHMELRIFINFVRIYKIMGSLFYL